MTDTLDANDEGTFSAFRLGFPRFPPSTYARFFSHSLLLIPKLFTVPFTSLVAIVYSLNCLHSCDGCLVLVLTGKTRYSVPSFMIPQRIPSIDFHTHQHHKKFIKAS